VFQIEAVQSDPRAVQMVDRLLQQHRDAVALINASKQSLLQNEN